MDTPMKRCTKCGESYPATPEYFHKDSQKKGGLYPSCIKCRIGADKAEIQVREARRKAINHGEDNWYYHLHREEVDVLRRERIETELARKRRERDARNALNPDKYQFTLERKREAQRERRRQNPQKYIDYQAEYRKKHPEKLKENARCWRASRRARSRSSEGKYTAKDVKAQFKSQNGKCWWCGKKVKKYDVDHLVPLSRGGTNHPNNIVIACPHCNRSRNNKLPHEWTNRLL